MKDGHGVLIEKNKGTYDGNWILDCKNGKGLFKDIKGNSFQEEWKNGKKIENKDN